MPKKTIKEPPIHHDQPVESKFPVYYFFYGTLTNPTRLKSILKLKQEPKLRRAEIVGYVTGKWGQYPALLHGRPGQVVTGYAYIVRSEDEAQRLAHYETNAYTVRSCSIYFRDREEPREIRGKVFMWAGDPQTLRRKKRFDWRLWILGMSDKQRGV